MISGEKFAAGPGFDFAVFHPQKDASKPTGYDYLAEKRQALVKWCDHLSRLVRKGSRPGLRLIRSGTAS